MLDPVAHVDEQGAGVIAPVVEEGVSGGPRELLGLDRARQGEDRRDLVAANGSSGRRRVLT